MLLSRKAGTRMTASLWLMPPPRATKKKIDYRARHTFLSVSPQEQNTLCFNFAFLSHFQQKRPVVAAKN